MIDNVSGKITQITAGNNHVCALFETGKVRCWGDNSGGQLGYGHTNTIGDNEDPNDVGFVSLFE